jgi:hypothetical protein
MQVMVTLHLPSGSTVHKAQPSVPEVGTAIRCNGEYWNVAAVVLDGPLGAVVAMLEPAAYDFDQQS